MKRLFGYLERTFADAALREGGVSPAKRADQYRPEHESIEENLIEVAFAEAADYEDIHEAILREHREASKAAPSGACGQGKNEFCLA